MNASERDTLSSRSSGGGLTAHSMADFNEETYAHHLDEVDFSSQQKSRRGPPKPHGSKRLSASGNHRRAKRSPRSDGATPRPLWPAMLHTDSSSKPMEHWSLSTVLPPTSSGRMRD